MTSTSVFNNLTSGLLTRSRSGVVQIIHYRRSKKQRQINDEEERFVLWIKFNTNALFLENFDRQNGKLGLF